MRVFEYDFGAPDVADEVDDGSAIVTVSGGAVAVVLAFPLSLFMFKTDGFQGRKN